MCLDVRKNGIYVSSSNDFSDGRHYVSLVLSLLVVFCCCSFLFFLLCFQLGPNSPKACDVNFLFTYSTSNPPPPHTPPLPPLLTPVQVGDRTNAFSHVNSYSLVSSSLWGLGACKCREREEGAPVATGTERGRCARRYR